MRFAAYYAIIVGVGMIGQWIMSYFSHQIQELKSEPVRIAFHITAEFITAFLLIVGGMGLLTGASWRINLYLISMGMLIYTALVSPGYFAQKGDWIWVAIFAVIIGLAIFSILRVIG